MKTINPSTVKFYTLGCKVNQYDTQRIRERFIQLGFKELEDSQPADICFINTCTVTQKADADSLNIIRRAKRDNPKSKIIVSGCLAELDEERIKKAATESLIVKNKHKENILGLLSSKFDLKELNGHRGRTNRGISDFKGHARAFLKIQDGCINLCSYCKVPLVRGISRSKPLKGIINEAKNLVKKGFKEIVLCGICLGAYGRDLKPRMNLVDCLKEIEKIPGEFRIRLSSLEAADVSGELINKMAQSKKLCRHLHIPIQSGDNTILKMMNRKYCSDSYLELIKTIKEQIPGIGITTDVLVGFPGEDEIKFKHTLKLIQDITPLKVHIFPYSKREGTAASRLNNGVDFLTIKKRIERLKIISDTCATLYKRQFLNSIMDVLIEDRAKENPDFWQGFTDNYVKVRLKSERDLKNQVVPLRLKKLEKDYILAEKTYG
jgi:threonylcarbamoyladenosine tRNA methylthiotransferase MtaB